MSKLKYVSNSILASLKKNVRENLDRYRGSGFEDLVAKGDWSIESKLDVDFSPLQGLDASGTADAEINNSMLVWRVLHNLTPALAFEERVWTRLTHVECLDYSCKRWIREKNDDEAVKTIVIHYFARGIGGCRDDNAISRLWWNAKIAKLLSPSDQEGALKQFLSKADFRLNSLERPRMFRRPQVGSAIIRLMQHEAWFQQEEENFRKFMRTLNRKGAGVLFEAMPDLSIDVFMNKCVAEAKLL